MVGITNLEPAVLECKVKWALGSITMNKASGGDGIPIELSQILKDDAGKVLHSICQQIWKAQQLTQDWKRTVLIPITKKGNAKRMLKLPQIAPISQASKVMFKILQARLQQYVNCELPDVQAGFKKAEEPEIKLPTSAGSWKKQESSRKNICFIDYAKAFDCVDHNKLWKIFQEMGISDHLICLLRNLYAGQEATIRTRHGTMGWVQNWERSIARLYIVTLLI